MWLCQTLTMNETLKWLSSLPILIQESFWWWQCSDRYIISLFHHRQSPVPNKPYGFCGRKAPWKKEEGSPGRPHLDFHTAPDLWRQDRRKHSLTAADKGNRSEQFTCGCTCAGVMQSSGAVWESRWPSCAVRPNEPYGFRGLKDLLNHASALVSACP